MWLLSETGNKLSFVRLGSEVVSDTPLLAAIEDEKEMEEEDEDEDERDEDEESICDGFDVWSLSDGWETTFGGWFTENKAVEGEEEEEGKINLRWPEKLLLESQVCSGGEDEVWIDADWNDPEKDASEVRD